MAGPQQAFSGIALRAFASHVTHGAYRMADYANRAVGREVAPDFDRLEHKFKHFLLQRSLTNPRFAEVLEVYDWAKQYYEGDLRDNGEPGFIHPLRNALRIARLIECTERNGVVLPHAIELLKATICHDMLEDKYNVLPPLQPITRGYLAHKIGDVAEGIVFNVSRKYHNNAGELVRKSKEEDKRDILSSPLSLLLKHVDRDDNLETMVDFTERSVPRNVIYTPEKQRDKMIEAIQVYLQASLPDVVAERYGAEWVKPLDVAREDLKGTVAKKFGQIATYFAMQMIDAKHEYPISQMLGVLGYPQPTRKRQKDLAPPPPVAPPRAA